ncbi:uncharacterized protein LOC110679023 isoform X2 [Aedes aegypti]|nr:uncharacterized protein LOC110679023 isoform X2 [Aedes aegypti]
MKFESDLTAEEIRFMILNYYIRHRLTQRALVDLLKMINLMVGSKILPECFEAFKAYFPEPYEISRIYYCTECQCRMGKSTPVKGAVCSIPECSGNKFDFFITIPVAQQLRETMIKYRKQIADYEDLVRSEGISDINKGAIVQELSTKIDGKTITLSVNTDGAAAYRWSINKPCYPIFVVVNNLPPRIRFDKKNLLMAAIWLNKGEPNIPLFFQEFCEEMMRLSKDFIIQSDVYNVVVVQNCLDSVARPKLQNSTQFNGRFGCSVCNHEGKVVNGNQIRYPFKTTDNRDHSETRQLMIEAHNTGTSIKGIKGLSVFLSIPHFDIVRGFPPDYMHSVLLGVVKQLWELFTASSNHTKPYYIGTQMSEVETRMLNIRTPSLFSRYPGKIEDMKKNKASDWENMLFHYFYPIVIGILPKTYLDNFMLLSTCIFQLLDTNLTEKTIDMVDIQLKNFVRKFQKLYGEENMYFNVHVLTHLPSSAKNFGALWNSSLYPYENGNGMILGFRNGNNHPVVQIAHKFMLNRICHNDAYLNNSSIITWHSNLWSSKPVQRITFDRELIFELSETLQIDETITEREFSHHNKFTYDGVQYCTRESCKELGYDDSFIKIGSHFYHIEHVLVDRNDRAHIIGRKLNTTQIFNNMFSYKNSSEYHLKQITHNVRPCVSISIQKEKNTVHYISACKPNTQIN